MYFFSVYLVVQMLLPMYQPNPEANALWANYNTRTALWANRPDCWYLHMTAPGVRYHSHVFHCGGRHSFKRMLTFDAVYPRCLRLGWVSFPWSFGSKH